MMHAVGLGAGGALLLTLATLTTNFVNIYMSSLAWKSLTPRSSDAGIIWSIGIIGTAISALPGVWLEQYTNLMVILGALLVPIGGVLVAHYYLTAAPADDSLIPDLYDAAGRFRGISTAGMTAWTAGAVAYFAANRWSGLGGTIPALAVSVLFYLAANRRASRREGRAWRHAAPAAGTRPRP
jgi:purine-cytosine permease-like protein